MRLIVFSDIHGNIYAFDEFVKQLQDEVYDYLIFCGDIFGYYYNQKEIIDKMGALNNLIWIRGNHDEYFLNLFSKKDTEKSYIEKYGHSYENVCEKFDVEVFALLNNTKPMYELIAKDKCIGIFHGTPSEPLEGRLYPDNEITNPELYQKYDIVILGHTHCRMKRFCGNTMIVNAGSLGQPRDGRGYGYAIIETQTNSVEFKNIYFNTDKLYEQIDMYDKNLTKLKEVLERDRK